MKLTSQKTASLIPAIIVGAALAMTPLSVFAQPVYTAGHGDLGIEYTPGETEFEAHWHLGADAVVDGVELGTEEEFAPDEIIAQVDGTSSVSSAAVVDALGVSPGTTVWRTGITAYPPNLGFALEEVGAPSDWLGETITLTLTGFSGPGEMALSQTIPLFGTFVWFSSYDAGATVAGNSWEFAVGSHQHLDWFFTETGFYEVEFTWAGTYVGTGGPLDVTGSGTFGINVGTGVVPEPGTWALLGMGLAALTILRRRRA